MSDPLERHLQALVGRAYDTWKEAYAALEAYRTEVERNDALPVVNVPLMGQTRAEQPRTPQGAVSGHTLQLLRGGAIEVGCEVRWVDPGSGPGVAFFETHQVIHSTEYEGREREPRMAPHPTDWAEAMNRRCTCEWRNDRPGTGAAAGEFEPYLAQVATDCPL